MTNKGTESRTFGGKDWREKNENVTEVEFKLPKDMRLVGLYGYVDSIIKGIGFYYKHLTTNIFGQNTGLPFSWWSKANFGSINIITVQ